MNKVFKLTILLLFCMMIACEKEQLEEEPLLFSEVIYGDWEVKEVIYRLTFGDFDYHPLNPPYPVYRFSRNGTFEIWVLEEAITFPEPFEVIDSTIYLGSMKWKMVAFSPDSLDIQGFDEHGLTARRLYKVD